MLPVGYCCALPHAIFASSQYCWLLLCTVTCWLFSHQVSTVGYCCALPCWLFSHQVNTIGYCCALPHADCFRIKSVLLVTAVHCHMLFSHQVSTVGYCCALPHADCFHMNSVLLVTAVHCHAVFALSQYCWLLLCTATCWLFLHQVSTVGYCCALPHAVFASELCRVQYPSETVLNIIMYNAQKSFSRKWKASTV